MSPEGLAFIVFVGGMLLLMGIGMNMALALVLTGAGMAWVLDFWDTQLLAQNLVANALKYAPSASTVRVAVSGGLTAWEIGRQLRAMGEDVALFEQLHPHYKDSAKLMSVVKQGRQQLEEQMAQERAEREKRRGPDWSGQ